MHFWCTFKKCIKSASKPLKSASKVHHFDALLKVHQKCIKSASKVHQKCIKSASKVHQKCIKSAPKVHQKCTKSIRSALHFWPCSSIFLKKTLDTCEKIFIWNWKWSKGLTKTSWMYLFKPAKGLPGFHPDLLQIVWEKSTTRVYELPFKFSFEKDMSSVPMDTFFNVSWSSFVANKPDPIKFGSLSLPGKNDKMWLLLLWYFT